MRINDYENKNDAPPCGWNGKLEDFIQSDNENLVKSLLLFNEQHLLLPVEINQIEAWRQSITSLKWVLLDLIQNIPEIKDWHIIFEYELPRERGRRPDVVFLSPGQVFVLEFKGYNYPDREFVDQTAAYGRDLQHYHEASHNLEVVSILVLETAKELLEVEEEVWICSPDKLPALLNSVINIQNNSAIEVEDWLFSDYAPLPSLISAARSIFEHDPLPYIRRAHSAGIPNTIKTLVEIAKKAERNQEYHLALVTGVPGAGKTLVGLQFVYENHFNDQGKERTAVFLSGNGPLVKVLQHALKSKVFVQDVHGFLRQYGGNRSTSPGENIFVFDEAQRAWDSARVLEKRGHEKSEPEDFLAIGSRKSWSLLVGLIGTGQEIHLGEESGLGQWNDAIKGNKTPVFVHCPPDVADYFEGAEELIIEPSLNLDTSLRTHIADNVQAWVEFLLNGDFEKAKTLTPIIYENHFHMYVTRDIDRAKKYVQQRYSGQDDKRFGLIASSKARNLEGSGIKNGYVWTRYFREGPWYNDLPSSKDSCCQLNEVATEFACQGLELDFPIVAWGDDLIWVGNHWHSFARGKARDPRQLRLNSYRVLLTCGRDGFIIYLPSGSESDTTYSVLKSIGVKDLDASLSERD